MKNFVSELKVEIVVFAIAILGGLIWLDLFGFQTMFFGFFESIYLWWGSFVPKVKGFVSGFASSFSMTGVIGFFILVIASVYVFGRTRSRYLVSEIYASRICPNCGENLKWIHRKWPDRILGMILFIPLHRFRCANRDCGWNGLRKPGRHHHQWDPQEEEHLRDQLSA